MAFFRCNLSAEASKKLNIAWIKKVSANSTINAEDCDFMLCSSTLTNLGADTVKMVSNATLVEKQRVDNQYEVEIYKDVSTITAIKNVRAYSETIAIGLTLA